MRRFRYSIIVLQVTALVLLAGRASPAPDYDLEVASAGLDRPLLNPAQFRRFSGRKAKIVTSKPVGNRVEFSGLIVTADETAVVIDDAHAGATPVPHAVIKRANLIYDPSADFKKLIAADTEKWAKVIRAANIKAE